MPNKYDIDYGRFLIIFIILCNVLISHPAANDNVAISKYACLTIAEYEKMKEVIDHFPDVKSNGIAEGIDTVVMDNEDYSLYYIWYFLGEDEKSCDLFITDKKDRKDTKLVRPEGWFKYVKTKTDYAYGKVIIFHDWKEHYKDYLKVVEIFKSKEDIGGVLAKSLGSNDPLVKRYRQNIEKWQGKIDTDGPVVAYYGFVSDERDIIEEFNEYPKYKDSITIISNIGYPEFEKGIYELRETENDIIIFAQPGIFTIPELGNNY